MLILSKGHCVIVSKSQYRKMQKEEIKSKKENAKHVERYL